MCLKDIMFKKSTYRELIAFVLQCRLDETGMTQAALAKNLGFKGSGNIISMHLDTKNCVSAFPVSRLPALKQECGLDWYECMVLLHKRAQSEGDGSTKLDVPTTRFILQCGRRAVADYHAKGGHGELSLGC